MTSNRVTIIGAGPAGLATALQLKRFGVEYILLEAERIGGLLNNANLVENYPGFPNGIRGPDLVQLIQQHAEKAGVKVTFDEVFRLDYQDRKFQIRTRDQIFTSKIVVIASGTKANRFPDELVSQDATDRIYYEVFHLLNTSGQVVGIVGAGDAAFDYALNLARNNQVMILNRGEKVKCLPLLWKRGCDSPDIQYREGIRINRITKTGKDNLRLDCQTYDGEEVIHVNYLLGAIGRRPRLDFISDQLQDKYNDLKQTGKLYFIGDVWRGLYRQTAIAVGDGIRAAMMINERIKEIDL